MPADDDGSKHQSQQCNDPVIQSSASNADQGLAAKDECDDEDDDEPQIVYANISKSIPVILFKFNHIHVCSQTKCQ